MYELDIYAFRYIQTDRMNLVSVFLVTLDV